MPRWGAERRARPLHEVPATSVLPQGGRRKDARLIAFRCGPVVRLSALRLPSFKGGVSWLGFLTSLFLASAKLGCEGASRQWKSSSSRNANAHKPSRRGSHSEISGK